MDYNLIPLATVKAITGATSDAVATQQGEAIIGLLQNYLGLVLKKQNFNNEKVTIPYPFSRVIKPRYAPINSVTSLGTITAEGTYEQSTKHLAVGEFTIEILPTFWSCFHYKVLPSAVSAVQISYNAGLFSTWQEVPAVLQEAAEELLKYKYNSGYVAGFNSEHLGDYSYSKGGFVNGLPVEIAGMLDGLNL